MKPYSRDLRERVLATVDAGEGSLEQIARRFCVSLSFVVRLLQRRRQTGSIDPQPHGGGQTPALTPQDLQRLRRLIQKHPDATLEELRQLLGLPCSIMAIWRALRKLKITRKKKVLYATQRKTPRVRAKRYRFRRKLVGLEPEHLVFVDETGATTAMTRTYGRAPRGERVVGTVPGFWTTLTLIAAMRLDGMGPALVFQGSTDTPAFQTYVDQVLVPQLHPGDVVIWDNLKPHHDENVRRSVKQAGAMVLPLPPYSPDLTPMEHLFSKVKGILKTLGARRTEELIDALGKALNYVRPQDILGWFNSCGVCASQA